MMELSQAKNLIEQSQNIVIAPARPVYGDSLGSALALFFTLRKLGKNANVLIDQIPDKFKFLAELPLQAAKDFVISIDGSGKEFSQVRYEKNEKGLKIFLALNKGEVSSQDVTFDALGNNPDLLIVLGSGTNLDFYQAPILDIGQLTTGDSSLSETTANLLRSIGQNLIDGNVATCLLTGIISASQNFRDVKTKPQTLAVAASLIESGADHQKIVQHLYKQKTIGQIKILGKILTKLSFDKNKEVYSAALTEKDFQECQASPRDLGYVVDELKLNFRYLPNLLILWESHSSPIIVRGLIYSTRPKLVQSILARYQGKAKGGGALFVTDNNDLGSVKEQILNLL